MPNTPENCPDAGAFFESFVSAVNAAWSEPNSISKHYSGEKSWTEAIFPVLEQLGREGFGYTGRGEARGVTTEHYRIDQCWFSYTGPPNETWNLDVAIEHENKPDAYLDEVQKLLAIRCPLRVVIGYPKATGPAEDAFEVHPDRGDRLKACLAGTRYQDQEPSELLLILGKGRGDEPPRWHGYQLLTDDPLAVAFRSP